MCKYCNKKATLRDDGSYRDYENEELLVRGEYTMLLIGVTEKDEIIMRAYGGDYTDNYYPKFCPECGRRLGVDS